MNAPIIETAAPAAGIPDRAEVLRTVDRLENMAALARFALERPDRKPADVACLISSIAEVAQRCADRMEARP